MFICKWEKVARKQMVKVERININIMKFLIKMTMKSIWGAQNKAQKIKVLAKQSYLCQISGACVNVEEKK